jgi:hypothetical protein
MRLNEIKFYIRLLLNKTIGEKILNETLRLKTKTVLSISVTLHSASRSLVGHLDGDSARQDAPTFTEECM